MNQGGKRPNSGRKKIGTVLNTRVDNNTLELIETTIPGRNRAEKIRNCLLLGIERHSKAMPLKSNSNNVVKSFAKTYSKIISNISYEFDNVKESMTFLNSIIFKLFFVSTDDMNESVNICDAIYIPISDTKTIDVSKIILELKKYQWRLLTSEEDNTGNTITPQILGYFFEQLINKKEMGAYYTPVDTTKYMCEVAIVSSILDNTPVKSELLQVMLTLFNYAPNIYLKTELSPHNSSAICYEDLIKNNADLRRLFIDSLNCKEFTQNYEVYKTIKDLSIIDPTVGTGAFIITAAYLLIDIFDKVGFDHYELSRKSYIKHIFTHNLYGVDIMEDAISILKFRIKLFLYEHGIVDEEFCGSLNSFKCGNSVYSTSDYSANELDKFSKIYNYHEERIPYSTPFDWHNEFPKVFDRGGFSCVVGNPPYIEWSKIKERRYPVDALQTSKCGNLYAFVFEKALKICNKNGFISLIVPISIVSTNRMKPLIDVIKKNCSYSFFSTFGDRPATLFSGVHQKTAISLCKVNSGTSNCDVYTSRYYHWTASERNNLFNRISYYLSEINNTNDLIYKTGNNLQESILRKIMSKEHSLTDILQRSETLYPIFLNMRATFWCKCFKVAQSSNEYKCFYTSNADYQNLIYSLFNSSLFYMIWEMTSDCWHITKDIFKLFTLGDVDTKSNIYSSAKLLSDRLSKDLEKNKRYIGSKQVEYEYLHKKSKTIIDEIDLLFAEYYSFTQDELSFILNYNLSYRMSDEYDNYIKGE